MIPTLGYIKTQTRILQVTSAAPDSPEFSSLVNAACERLLNRGDWKGTLAPIYVCVQNGQVTWPRYVHAVRKLNRCDREIKVNNIWYQFIDRDFYSNCIGESYANVVRPLVPHDAMRNMNALGYYSTYNDVPTPSYIQAWPAIAADVGQTVTIFGNDSNGNPLMTNVGGVWQNGMVLTLALPYVQSTIAVAPGSIRVTKTATQGQVRLYAADMVTGNALDLAIYDPSETNPGYSRYRLHGGWSCPPNTTYGVLALVKLEFIPAIQDGDLVLIDNPAAIAYAIQSIKAGENGDVPGSESFMKKAVGELNLQLQNETPDWQTPVVFKPFGSANPRRAGIGRII